MTQEEHDRALRELGVPTKNRGAVMAWYSTFTTYKMARLPILMQAQTEKPMSKVIEVLLEAAQNARDTAEQCRRDAANARKRLDKLESDALDYDNQAIDIEDAILKLEGENS